MKISRRGYIWIALTGLSLTIWGLIILGTIAVLNLINGS